MARQNQFTVDAESVQNEPGAEVTFWRMEVGVWKSYKDDPASTNKELLARQIASWKGFVDAEGHELPQPKDEPDVIDRLYSEEQQKLVLLLLAGPEGESAKNSESA